MNKIEIAAARQVASSQDNILEPLEVNRATHPTLCLAAAAEWAVNVIAAARYATRHAAEEGVACDTGTFLGYNRKLGELAETTPLSISELMSVYA
jgi:hypothetical protein